MLKSIIVAIVFAGLGIGMGMVQASLSNNSSEERFSTYRPTLAMRMKEVTEEEVLQQTSGTGQPKAEVVGEDEYDFGSMLHGTEMSHDFRFRNAGDAPLTLEMGDSSCKCTVGELDKTVLQPGEETDVTLTWSAKSVTRDFGQYANIKTTDVHNPEIKLSIFGQITEVVSVVPRVLRLDSISDTEVTERKLMVYTYSKDIDTLKLSWTDDSTDKLVELTQTQIDVSDITDADHKNAVGAYEIKFKLKPGMPLGSLGANIQLRTNREERIGVLEIPVRGRAIGSLQLAGGPSFLPDRNLVKMGNISQSEGRKVSISLFIQGDNKKDIIPEVLSVSPAEALQVEIGESTETAKRIHYPLHFVVPKDAPETHLDGRTSESSGQVVIKTSGALSRELRINVQLDVAQ